MLFTERVERTAAIEDFLHRLRPRLRGVLAQYRIPLEDAEDVLQQALLALVYQWEDIREPEAWLIGTVRNKCLIYWRQRRRSLYDAVDGALLEFLSEAVRPGQERGDLARDLSEHIARLPARCQRILRLRYGLGYDPPEVAEQTGYRPSSISKLHARCLAALNRELIASGFFRRARTMPAELEAAADASRAQVRTPRKR